MCDGYNSSPTEDHPSLEDELLCEYVDGTMDPVVREVFDEYLLANPDVRDHVECLRSTRMLLCHYGCRCHAPRDLHDRLRRQITCDLINGKVPFYILVADRLRGATMSSAMALIMMLGLVGSFSLTQEGGVGTPGIISAAVVTPSVADDRPSHWSSPVIASTPHFSPRMSSIGPVPATRTFLSSQVSSQAVLQTDTSGTLRLERSSLLP